MKFLSVILSVMIMTLATTPCCPSAYQTDNCKEKSSKKHKDCSDNCSPFHSCSNCSGFICSYPPTIVVIEKILTDIVTPTNYSAILIPRFPDSIWQPPKIA